MDSSAPALMQTAKKEVFRWNRRSTHVSLQEYWRCAGPAFLVSTGYIDPGNWGTDIDAGARFGYRLVWAILLSNLMAIFLQSLTAKLGIATGRTLAETCRQYLPRPIAVGLWVTAEGAMMATDLAELIEG